VVEREVVASGGGRGALNYVVVVSGCKRES